MNETQQNVEAKFMSDWRSSPYYEFVMRAIDNELERSYVRDIVVDRTVNNLPMDDEEIGKQVKIEVQTNFRLKSIRDVLA